MYSPWSRESGARSRRRFEMRTVLGITIEGFLIFPLGFLSLREVQNHSIILGMRVATPVLLLLTVPLAGCGLSADCALNGETLQGRVTFGKTVSVRNDVDVVIQYSQNSFSTSIDRVQKSNPQGLLTVPYGFCAAEGSYQVRAFQDLNGNGNLDSGESYGLMDGTDVGDASYINKTIQKLPDGSTQRVTDADVTIDNP